MTIDWKNIRLLLVDMDNTLADTFHTLSVPQWKRVERALRHKGWPDCADKLRDNFGHGFVHTLKLCGFTKAQMEFAVKEYDKIDVSPLKLYPDAHAILDVKMPKILITRGTPSLQKMKISQLGIRKYFDDILLVEPFDTKEDAIERLLATSPYKKGEILIIGDRIEEEIAIGKRMGIPTILVRRPDWPVAKSKVKPDLTVRKLSTIARNLNR